jgi:hypothetical protein
MTKEKAKAVKRKIPTFKKDEPLKLNGTFEGVVSLFMKDADKKVKVKKQTKKTK